MSREWQPGDVAVIVGDSFAHGQRAMFCVNEEGDRRAWAVASTDGLSMSFGDKSVRPLVVIDPSDREQVERLLCCYFAADNLHAARPARGAVDKMQAALREFANPTQPKLEEPTGLGAVVEDANGVRHVRTFAGSALTVWLGHIQGDGGERTRRWADIDTVKVLSEGVIA